MTYQNDPNRDDRLRRRDTGMGWGIPLGIAAVIAVVVGIFVFNKGDRATTANNNSPVTTQTAPVPRATPETPASVPARPGVGG